MVIRKFFSQLLIFFNLSGDLWGKVKDSHGNPLDSTLKNVYNKLAESKFPMEVYRNESNQGFYHR